MKLTLALTAFTFILVLVSCDKDEVVREILVNDDHTIDYMALSENSELLYYISDNKVKKYDFNTNTSTTLGFDLTTVGSVIDMWTNENGNQLYLVSQKVEYPKLTNMITSVDPVTLESEVLLDSIMGTSFYGELLRPVLHQKDYISFVKAYGSSCQLYTISSKIETSVSGSAFGEQFSTGGSRFLLKKGDEKLIYHTNDGTLHNLEDENLTDLIRNFFTEKSNFVITTPADKTISITNALTGETIASVSIALPDDQPYEVDLMSEISPSGKYFSYVDYACLQSSCDFVVNVREISSGNTKIIAQGDIESGVPSHLTFSKDETQMIYSIGNKIIIKPTGK